MRNDPADGRVTAVLDAERMEELRELSEDGTLLRTLIDQFLSGLPAQVDALRVAVERGDPSALEQAAHRLKGSSGNFGAETLAALCASLEMLGRSQSMAGASQLFQRIEPETKRVKDALESELGRSV